MEAFTVSLHHAERCAKDVICRAKLLPTGPPGCGKSCAAIGAALKARANVLTIPLHRLRENKHEEVCTHSRSHFLSQSWKYIATEQSHVVDQDLLRNGI